MPPLTGQALMAHDFHEQAEIRQKKFSLTQTKGYRTFALKQIPQSAYAQRNGYKLRISVNPKQLHQAITVLVPILFAESSPLITGKISHPTELAEIAKQRKDVADLILRMVTGGQVTIYCHFDDDLIKFSQLLIRIETALLDNDITPGTPPMSDTLLSDYISGRCECMLDKDGASSNPVDEDSYVFAGSEVSTDSANAYLFLFYQVVLLVENSRQSLSAEKSAQIRSIMQTFNENHQILACQDHYNMTLKLINNLLPVYPTEDTTGRVKLIKIQNHLTFIGKTKGYNRPTPTYQQQIRINQKQASKRRMQAAQTFDKSPATTGNNPTPRDQTQRSGPETEYNPDKSIASTSL